MAFTVAIDTDKDIENFVKNFENEDEKNRAHEALTFLLHGKTAEIDSHLPGLGPGHIKFDTGNHKKMKISYAAAGNKDSTKLIQNDSDLENLLKHFLTVHKEYGSVFAGKGKGLGSGKGVYIDINLDIGSGSKTSKDDISVSTAQQEIITGIFCKLALDGKKLNTGDAGFKDMFIQWYDKVNKHPTSAVNKTITKEALWEIVEKNPAKWVDSFVIVGQKFGSKFKNKQLDLYFGSEAGPLHTIYETAKKLLAKTNFNSEINKWSPADIWFLDSKGVTAVNKEIAKASTIEELNGILMKNIKSENIIPVSLKKVVGSVKVEEYNFDRDKNNKVLFPIKPSDITHIKLLKLDEKSFFKNAGGGIKFHVSVGGKSADETITGRNFQGITSFYLEIIGKNAAGGKTNMHALEGIIKEHTGKPVNIEKDYKKIHEFFGQKYVKSGKQVTVQQVEHDEAVIKDFWEKVYDISSLAQSHRILFEAAERNSPFLQYTANILLEAAKKSKEPVQKDILKVKTGKHVPEEFIEKFKQQDLAWKTSKFLFVEMIWNVLKHSSGDGVLKAVILDLFRIASSQHDLSAPFYKFS